MSLASTEYPEGVNEFIKSGLTPLASENVSPPRVKESPVQFECTVKDIVELGTEGGAGNLIICEVVRMHINPEILDKSGAINPYRIDLVARMGGDWYCRAQGEALFEVAKPLRKMGIGVDALPKPIRDSTILRGNDLGKLGNVESLPNDAKVAEFSHHHKIQDIFNRSSNGMEVRELLHEYARELLDEGKVEKAWKALLCDRLNRL
jgi:hypothetical protein